MISKGSVFFVGRVSDNPQPVPPGPVAPPASPDLDNRPPFLVPLDVIESLHDVLGLTRAVIEIRGSWMKKGELWLIHASRSRDGTLRPWTCGHMRRFDPNDHLFSSFADRVAKAAKGVVEQGTINVRVTADLHAVKGAMVTIAGRPSGMQCLAPKALLFSAICHRENTPQPPFNLGIGN